MGSDLTELELMKKGQWSSTKAMGNYLHGNDAGKRKTQLKRIAKRGTRVWIFYTRRGRARPRRRTVLLTDGENFVGSVQPGLSEVGIVRRLSC